MEPAHRPRIGVTIGDVAGVGPEIVLRAVAGRDDADFTIIGPAGIIASAAALLHLPLPLSVRETGPVDVKWLAAGKAAPETGEASHRAVEEGARMAVAGEIDALVTAPISKTAWSMAGYSDPGHTELLADICLRAYPRLPPSTVVMAFQGTEDSGETLRVALATIHKPVAQVPPLIRRERLLDLILAIARDLRERFGIAEPRIGVCGLNPHAGESGRIGREDLEEILPAIEDAQSEGVRAEGPLPGDAAFTPRLRSRYDLLLAMFHDQGLAPFKALTAGRGVNVTLGLPILRTSPDHGTAFDIAGRWSADYGSMSAAIDLAIELAKRRSAS